MRRPAMYRLLLLAFLLIAAAVPAAAHEAPAAAHHTSTAHQAPTAAPGDSAAASETPAAAAPEAPTAAAAPADGGFQSDVASDLARTGEKLVALAEAIPAEKYGWRPGDGVRSVSEVLMHVANANLLLPPGLGTTPPADRALPQDMPAAMAWMQEREATMTAKDEVLRELRQSLDYAAGAVRTVATPTRRASTSSASPPRAEPTSSSSSPTTTSTWARRSPTPAASASPHRGANGRRPRRLRSRAGTEAVRVIGARNRVRDNEPRSNSTFWGKRGAG